jgi:hypothetical protein
MHRGNDYFEKRNTAELLSLVDSQRILDQKQKGEDFLVFTPF